ncbi:zona pellucida sperm-binding protein 2-like [Centropristis striata]|uniref:zona pellucida sperm-binding protein 2-like n=1 Tax=Centropristis striata TaxID=184440 RepID=UPI0027E0A2D5|nr:zona pellucida sperm-binding protein 2-like [Centropristis striata]
MRKLDNILLWSLMAAVILLGQARPNTKLNSQSSGGLRSDCAGNLMRLSLDEALAVGNQLEVEAINGTQHIVLTPSLAAQCGYSMESDPWGNTRIYTSLMGCYVDNKDDTTFTVGLRLRMYGQSVSDVVSHDVSQSCSYSRWASREVLCDRNYMEVSNFMTKPDPQTEAKGPTQDVKDDSKINNTPDASGAAQGIWKMTFHTPEPVPMVLREAEQAGYGAMTTTSRMVMRSPYNTAETYSEDVAGVPMEVLRVSVYYKAPHGLSLVNLAAACPTGGVLFTDDLISWHVPRRITPLVDGGVTVLEMHMGINGQRLERSRMAARGYTLSTTDFHIVIEIPVGSPDGYFKSHAPDYQYHTTYIVEPMLEVLWRADNSQEDTRYKVLFPITTPLMPQTPHLQDNTVPEDRVFNVHLGTFLQDVELRNITFSTGVLTVDQVKARGFLLQEHHLPNGNKSFSLQVPFSADVVLKHNPELLVTSYFLPLTFGFIILPEETPFSHPVEVEASLQDVVLPTISGSCDQSQFYISVKYGSQGTNFQGMIGAREMTPPIAELYHIQENATHFSLVVPYAAEDAAFELITENSVRSRIDMLLFDPNNNWVLADLYLACSFPLIITTCHSNGTITSLAVKVESVPNLDPGLLTLTDPSCRPEFSNDRFATFTFSVDSCGTTRTFFDHYMLYENEISLYYNKPEAAASAPKGVAQTSPIDPEYRQTISCYYVVNETRSVAFSSKQRRNDPTAEIGSGRLMTQMRLAQDASYGFFYQAEDYPVVAYLRQPLYFEAELMESTDPNLELILENCWATLYEDRTSLPSWDIIVDTCENPDDGYMTVFHPVSSDARVLVPSHFKRFSIKMFTFTKDEEVLRNGIYVHCDAVICDTNSQADASCRGQCVHVEGLGNSRHQAIKGGLKRERRSTDSTNQRQLSSGPILYNTWSKL